MASVRAGVSDRQVCPLMPRPKSDVRPGAAAHSAAVNGRHGRVADVLPRICLRMCWVNGGRWRMTSVRSDLTGLDSVGGMFRGVGGGMYSQGPDRLSGSRLWTTLLSGQTHSLHRFMAVMDWQASLRRWLADN